MSVVAKKRENYKPLLWNPINIYLDFQIHKNYTFVKSNIHSFILHSNTYPKQSIHLFLQLSPTSSLEYHFTFWPPNHFIFGNTEPNQTQDSFY